MKPCVKYFAILFSVFFVSIIGYIYNESYDKTVTFVYWEDVIKDPVNSTWYKYLYQRIAEHGYKLKVSDNINKSDIVIWG